jgi:surfactin synthase thioesterase subunit
MTGWATADWLAAPVARPDADLRLLCLPHAGGGTAPYAALARRLPGTIDLRPVRLPGRETRLREQPYRRMSALVDDAVRALEPVLERPYALFGHSLGALLAYELAHRLRAMGAPEPAHLFVSGRRAPQLADPESPLSALPDDQLVAELSRRYDGIPRAVLETPELLELFLPVLRADCELLDTYVYAEREALAVPISAFTGVDDRRVGMPELNGWRDQTTAAFRIGSLPGGHFYFHGAEEALAAELERDLAQIVMARRVPA